MNETDQLVELSWFNTTIDIEDVTYSRVGRTGKSQLSGVLRRINETWLAVKSFIQYKAGNQTIKNDEQVT